MIGQLTPIGAPDRRTPQPPSCRLLTQVNERAALNWKDARCIFSMAFDPEPR
jgi:hypothetical protein